MSGLFSRGTAVTACTATLAVVAMCCPAQTLLYDNGAFVTQSGVGFGGADVSRTESGTVIGLGNNVTSPAVIADDFVVPSEAMGGWRLERLTWWAFQGQSAPFNTNNTFTGAFVRLYNGDPSTGGEVVAGDLETDRLLEGVFANAFRLSTTGSAADQSRPIMRLEIDVSDFPVLPPGSYWLGVALAVDPLFTRPIFSFPVTPRDLSTDNGVQFFQTSWFVTQLDYPFLLHGEVATPCPLDLSGDGVVNADDIFAFLTLWFAGPPGGTCGGCNADWSGNGVIDADDIFRYLVDWFAFGPGLTCP